MNSGWVLRMSKHVGIGWCAAVVVLLAGGVSWAAMGENRFQVTPTFIDFNSDGFSGGGENPFDEPLLPPPMLMDDPNPPIDLPTNIPDWPVDTPTIDPRPPTDPPAVVPEPMSFSLMFGGAAVLAFARRRRKRSSADR